jgi:spore maturation protein CgeB
MRTGSHELRLLLVGNPEPTHVGGHLLDAAHELGITTAVCDINEAWTGPGILRRLSWWLRDRKPPRFRSFNRFVQEQCRQFRPSCLLVTGLAPLARHTLEIAGALGPYRVNYLTDDPWNPSHRCKWFLDSLPAFDAIYSPRRANLDDLKKAGGRHIHYLPFAYAPKAHFPAAPLAANERRLLESDVLFVGTADHDRLPFIEALLSAGLRVALYGMYWDKHITTRESSRGLVGPELLRKAIACAGVCLCLVRRANRDGHVMRSFEAPASRSAMLVEDTQEHRELFGENGEAVIYFKSISEMVFGAKRICADEPLRQRLAENAFHAITSRPNTYQDRLADILRAVP